MIVSGHAETTPSAATQARTYCVILFPAYLEERMEQLLDDVGVPGYSRAPDVVGRGPHGRHFNNQVWPGATGEIFTVVDNGCADDLLRQLTAFDASLRAESRGLYGLHVLTWPCQALL